MNEERKRILGMLAEGKITADEADLLLDSVGSGGEAVTPPPAPSAAAGWPAGPAASGTPKFMYVKISGKDQVDVKVPLGLLRAGLKLTSLIPPEAMEQISDSMGEHGMSIDFNNLKPDDIEELIANLREMEVNINTAEGDNVRVFCA